MAIALDASAWVDLLLNNDIGARVAQRIGEDHLVAPAHIDLEMLSALARMHRAGELEATDIDELLVDARATPIERYPLPELTAGAWARQGNLRVSDALYVELAVRMDVPLITTDHRLARATPHAEAV